VKVPSKGAMGGIGVVALVAALSPTLLQMADKYYAYRKEMAMIERTSSAFQLCVTKCEFMHGHWWKGGCMDEQGNEIPLECT